MSHDDAIPDAPVYTATLEEMENLEELLAKANEIAIKYGAVRIDPPSTWPQPPLRMAPKSRFFVRMQTLPAAPFADPYIVNQANTAKNHPRKRGRRNTLTPADDDSDDPAPEPKQQKTTRRDRAARAASRSHRNHLKPSEQDKQALLDHLAKADFHSERTHSNIPFESPPNPHCTPVPSPPPELPPTQTKSPAACAEPPSSPIQKPQSFARPSSREPSAKPTAVSSGQSQAVREAALRLAEAFTGPAKAGPAQNAAAIPPCPFSQQIAQQLIAKRTAEDQNRLPLQKPSPTNIPVQPTLAAPTAQVGNGRERNVLAVGSVSGIAGGNVGIQSRIASNRAGTDAIIKSHATSPPKFRITSLKPVAPLRESERKDRSRPAFERYIEGKNDEALLLDDTRIPRVNSKSVGPFSAAKQISLRAQVAMPKTAENFPNDAPHRSTGSPHNKASNLLSAFSGVALFVRKEAPVNDPAAPIAHQNVRQPQLIGMNTCQTGNHVRPHPSTSRGVHAFEGEGYTSSVPQSGPFPMLRSVPLQSHGSRTPERASIATRREKEGRNGLLCSNTNASAQQQKGELQTHAMIIPRSNDKGVAASISSPILEKVTATEKHWNEDRGERPSETAPEEKAVCREQKDKEFPSSGCAANMVPDVPLGDHLKTQRNNTCDELRELGQRQIPDIPFDDAVRPPTTAFKGNDKVTQIEKPVSVRNAAAPWTGTMEISSSALPIIPNQVHSPSTAHHLTSQSGSHTFAIRNICLSPKPRASASVFVADQNNSWNPCHDIVEEIFAGATRSVDTELLRVKQQHTREDGVNPVHSVAIRPKAKQSAPSQGPSHQLTTEETHIGNSTSGTDPFYERTPRSCKDQRYQVVGVNQTQEEPRAVNTQAHTTSAHLVELTACVEEHPQQEHVAGFVSGEVLSVAPNTDSAGAPESILKDISEREQPSDQQKPIINTEIVDDVIFVSERTSEQQRGNPSLNRPKPEDIIHLDDEKPPISAPKQDVASAKPPGKRTVKRKTGFKNLQVDQDEVGRLTKAIVFPDSGTPITLASYEKKAQEHHDQTKKTLNSTTEEMICTSNVENVLPKLDMCDVDTLETEFWKAMSGGIRGRPVTVAYGVDVEAEGAFDSNEMSYVEWHGSDPVGSNTKKRKRGRPRIHKRPKPESKQEPVDNTKRQSSIETHKTLRDELHEDADDEMDHDDNNNTRRSEHRVQTEKFESNPRGHKTKGQTKGPKPHFPRSHVGTLNRDGLLRHMPRMPGINHSMYYVGQLFTRFCWHTEDAFLNSVSYLHPGSAKKVWYAVPPEFAPAFEEFAASSVFSPSLLDSENAGRVLLMNKTTMFDPRRVRRKGVAVYRVVHKPGSFVLTAPRAYHAGFNCGFNIAEAVNFASPTWFPVGREASLFARKAIRPLCVPWEYLLFHEAKSLRDISNGVSKKTPSMQRLETNARVVAKEFKAIIIDGEQKIRKYAETRNCRVSMLHEISGLAKHNQLGPEFGNGAGMVCSLCSHACHFYAEMCGSCDDTFEARCVDHFGKGHRLCLHESHKTVIVRRHDPVLLLDILGCLEKLAGIPVDAHEIAQRYVGYIRTWQTPLRASGLRLRLNLKAATSRLPPKVSKDKGDREKIAKTKVIRDKTHREKRRKIRKQVGSFARTGENGKRDLHTKAEILGGIDVFTALERNDGVVSNGGLDSKRVFGDARDTMGKIPLF